MNWTAELEAIDRQKGKEKKFFEEIEINLREQ
jgi:hypothetical protein